MSAETMSDLYDKAMQELTEFLDNMEQKPPKEIIESAYEITIKKDVESVLFDVNEDDLTEDQIMALLSSNNVLDEVYSEYISSESYTEYSDIVTCIGDTADKIVEANNRDKLQSFQEYAESAIENKELNHECEIS